MNTSTEDYVDFLNVYENEVGRIAKLAFGNPDEDTVLDTLVDRFVGSDNAALILHISPNRDAGNFMQWKDIYSLRQALVFGAGMAMHKDIGVELDALEEETLEEEEKCQDSSDLGYAQW